MSRLALIIVLSGSVILAIDDIPLIPSHPTAFGPAFLRSALSGLFFGAAAEASTSEDFRRRAGTGVVVFPDLDQSADCPYSRAKRNERLTRSDLNNLLRKHEAWVRQYQDQLWGQSLSDLRGRKEIQDPRRLNLCGADLKELDLSGHDLSWADLSRATLIRTNLSKVVAQGLSFQGASLWDTNLKDAKLWRVDFNKAFLYVNVDNFPDIDPLGTSKNLNTIRICYNLGTPNEACMFVTAGELRNKFRQYGMRKQEREITAAMKRWEAKQEGAFVEALNWAFLGWTSGYGVNPFRPLVFVLFLLISCTPVYVQAITGKANRPSFRYKMSPMFWAMVTALIFGILLLALSTSVGLDTFDRWSLFGWLAVWTMVSLTYWLGINFTKSDSHVIEYCLGDATPNESDWRHFGSGDLASGAEAGGEGNRDRAAPRLWRIWMAGLYFSLVTALRIGWRDLNAGTWITAMHPRRLRLRALGWIRVVAGFQSVASIYFIALWALTYFGRPFE